MPSVDQFMAENKRLIDAIIEVESDGDKWASRYERVYRYLWDTVADRPFTALTLSTPQDFKTANGRHRHTEFIHQRTSWGPMQVMGAVAREYGYKGLLPALCGKMGIYYGALHLLKLKRRLENAGHARQTDLIASYNGGWAYFDAEGKYKNQAYVDKVLKALDGEA